MPEKKRFKKKKTRGGSWGENLLLHSQKKVGKLGKKEGTDDWDWTVPRCWLGERL